MERSEVLRCYERHFNPSLALLFDLGEAAVEASGRGTRVYDRDGREYLDFAAGMGVFGVGHANERVRAAVLGQLRSLPTAPSDLYNEPAARLMQRLAELLPGDLDRVVLASSGCEAVDVALRIARLRHPGRKGLVAATNGYHGKTVGVLGFLGQEYLRKPFEPLLADVRFVPFGDADAMARAVDESTAAVFLEPILGCGHITVPPDGYLARVKEACDRTGTLLVVDEVQTGFARTGKMFGIEHDGIVPDAVILSKAITGGHTPMAAVVLREAVVETLDRCADASLLSSGSDGAGSPIACAAACAAIEFIVEHRLARHVAELGPHLQQRLESVAEAFPKLVLGSAGRGLMAGARLRNNALEYAVCLQMLRRGVLAGYSTNPTARRPVIRFYPPLVVEKDEIDVAVDAFHESVAELNRWPALVHDLANEAVRFQFHVPKRVLRFFGRILN